MYTQLKSYWVVIVDRVYCDPIKDHHAHGVKSLRSCWPFYNIWELSLLTPDDAAAKSSIVSAFIVLLYSFHIHTSVLCLTGTVRLFKLTSSAIHVVFMVFMIEHIEFRWQKLNKWKWMMKGRKCGLRKARRRETSMKGSRSCLQFEADYSRVPSSVDRWKGRIDPVLVDCRSRVH